jgi:hypothetical protein
LVGLRFAQVISPRRVFSSERHVRGGPGRLGRGERQHRRVEGPPQAHYSPDERKPVPFRGRPPQPSCLSWSSASIQPRLLTSSGLLPVVTSTGPAELLRNRTRALNVRSVRSTSESPARGSRGWWWLRPFHPQRRHMSIWLLILIIVIVVLALGGFGYSRR